MRVSEKVKIAEIEKWKENDIITISAGTGAGKSYFIKNILYAFAKSENKKILFLVHRTNCFKQFKDELVRDKKTDVIDLMTYQHVETVAGHKGYIDLHKYKYIVCDEFHYFFTDAAFSHTTGISIDSILNTDKSIKIFMSATGDRMLKYLKDVRELEVKKYPIATNFDFIDCLKFFNKYETIETLLERVITTDLKVLVFLHSAKRAYEMYLKFKEHALFNCSTSNKEYYKYVDKEKIDDVLKNEKFDTNILITTTCMDAGVNIWDSKLYFVVLDVEDIDVLRQCLGRKRLYENEKINVLIKNMTNEQLGGRKSQVKQKMEKAEYLMNHTDKEYLLKYPRENDRHHIVYPTEGNEGLELKINRLMYYKCRADLADINNMLKNGYANYMYYELLGQKGNWEVIELAKEQEDNNKKLTKYLQKYVTEKIVMLQGKDRKEIIERINANSEGKLLRKIGALNEALEKRKIPFRVIEFSTSRMIDGKKKNFKAAWKIISI